MLPKPQADLKANTLEYEVTPLVKPTGFREYDARWVLESEINLLGIQALGQGLGTLIREMGKDPRIVVGHDFRGYSVSVKQALTVGLMTAGMEVNDIGLALSPVAYFAQFDLDIPCVAMVTAQPQRKWLDRRENGRSTTANIWSRRNGPVERNCA